MKTTDFDYSLPEELIAQFPPKERGSSRLLVFNRKTNRIIHSQFREIISFLKDGDLLVFNDTRVIPARLLGKKESGGKVEVFLVRELEDGLWEAMIKASKSPSPGANLMLEDEIGAVLLKKEGNTFLLRLSSPGNLKETIMRVGRMPLPPYIKRDATALDRERYQNVFAKVDGAVAAPTAGLHFTNEIMDELANKGVKIETITLHIGPGTFQPVRAENIKDHKMHSEYFEVSADVAGKVNNTRAAGGRIVAVGTTVLRALESSFTEGKVLPKADWTDIFIHPGCRLKVVDSLITNFHLPKSTLFMLVSAIVGTKRVKEIYNEAVTEGYRFFSYGDAMLVQ